MEPLANRLRPTSIGEMVGQPHILHKEGLILQSIKKMRLELRYTQMNPSYRALEKLRHSKPLIIN